MPTTDGAKKADRTQKRKRVYNDRRKREMKRQMKELKNLAEEGKYDEANERLADVYKAIDKAAKRGAIHQNKADRKKSQASDIAKKPE